MHVFTHNLNTLLVKDEKRKGEGKRTEDVNGGWAGDAKAGKTFWDQIRKKKIKTKCAPKEERNLKGSKKSQNKAK